MYAYSLQLVSSIAKRFLNRGYEYEDLFQIGCVGFVKAVNRFDTSYDVKLSTYAFPIIDGEIRRFLREDGLIRVSRNLKALHTELYKAKEKLADKLSREPTVRELSEYTGYTEKEIENCFTALTKTMSLDNVIYDSESSDITLADTLSADYNLEEEVERNFKIQFIKDCIDKLKPLQRDIVKLRLQEKTQKDIAEKLGITQVHVSRTEKKAHKRLKELILEEDTIMSNRDKAFEMFKEGVDNKTIVEKLGLTLRTVETYRSQYNRENKVNKPKEVTTKATNIQPKSIETKQETILIRPVLFEGKDIKYKIVEQGICIINTNGNICISKSNIDVFIKELMELKKAI